MLKENYSGVEAVVAWLLPLALSVNMWISPGSLVLWGKQTDVLQREFKGGVLRRLYRDISFTSAL
jgi:hypothetical protein